MEVFVKNENRFQFFMDDVDRIIAELSGCAKKEETDSLLTFKENFDRKTKDFYRENRKLNIGVVGQVKAGKSTFLNTLLFDGKEILPKAATPKTATLTKMEYASENRMEIEYYSAEEWEVLEDNALVDLDDEIYTSAREIVGMIRRNGIDPAPYLEKGFDTRAFGTYEELLENLNDYVGENGTYTPIIKAVTLYLNKDEFRGLSIVDTPGLNDPIASRTIRTKEFMEVCDVVFFLSQSGSFLDKSDWTLLSSQLPQKGVKRLALIASKYDSGIRDILRPQEDDPFGEDDNTADNIPKACKIIRKKLKKRAKSKVEEFAEDLKRRDGTPELIRVIEQCKEPHMVSSLACNMAEKDFSLYTAEERNLYHALEKYSSDMASDLKLLGNFEEVRGIFAEVVKEKEKILEEKEKGFIPDAAEELKGMLFANMDKAKKRIEILQKNDKEQLLVQRRAMETQMVGIKADIVSVFGGMNTKLEIEKTEGMQRMRQAEKDYTGVREHAGQKEVRESYTVRDSKWYKPWTWGRSHKEYTYRTEHYSYCIAADAVENLKKYATEATGQIESVFTEALNLKGIKRELLDVIMKNFDMGSEKYDSSLFRIMVEETVSAIEFPIFRIDISQEVDGIAGKFTGELTSAGEKTQLTTALAKAVSGIYNELAKQLETKVREFKEAMNQVSAHTEQRLLHDIRQEFESLLEQCDHKEKEIARYQEYVKALEKSVAHLG